MENNLSTRPNEHYIPNIIVGNFGQKRTNRDNSQNVPCTRYIYEHANSTRYTEKRRENMVDAYIRKLNGQYNV